MSKDTYTCDTCGFEEKWDAHDDRRGDIWECEYCGAHFCTECFVKKLGREMVETFPEFWENAYYKERVGAEEQKLIKMQLSSTVRFICYYKLLWGYRNLRKAIKGRIRE